jgi:hypothetical protein
MGLSPKSEPPAAWAALSGIGAARLHDPLPLLRARVDAAFPADVEAAAQVWGVRWARALKRACAVGRYCMQRRACRHWAIQGEGVG